MQKPKQTYTGAQHDEIESLLDDATKLMSHPDSFKEGRAWLKLAEVRIKREANRLIYAKLTGQQPNISPLEPAPNLKKLPDAK